jgi:inorganic phosphate transporter, PiT family
VGLSLLISPLLGFCLAGGLLLLSKALIHNRRLYDEPHADQPPPFWIRAILFVTCTGVSFAHGSNDGQKGVGLIMLILIGILPAHYSLNQAISQSQLQKTTGSIEQVETVVAGFSGDATASGIQHELQQIRNTLTSVHDLRHLAGQHFKCR